MSEKAVQKQVCDYLKQQYRNVIFFSDLSGLYIPEETTTIKNFKWRILSQIKGLKSQKGIPDLIILEPRGDYHALTIELKDEGKLYKKNGDMFKNEHLQEQIELTSFLIERGYCSLIAEGFEHAKKIIDLYMGKPINYKKKNEMK